MPCASIETDVFAVLGDSCMVSPVCLLEWAGGEHFSAGGHTCMSWFWCIRVAQVFSFVVWRDNGGTRRHRRSNDLSTRVRDAFRGWRLLRERFWGPCTRARDFLVDARPWRAFAVVRMGPVASRRASYRCAIEFWACSEAPLRTGIFRTGDRCVFRGLSVLFWVSCVFRRVFVVIKVGFCPDLDCYVVLLGKRVSRWSWEEKG